MDDDVSHPSIMADDKHSQDVPAKRFEIKKWSAVGMWSWDLQVDTCAICRNHLMEVCIECQASGGSLDECKIAWGSCNHAFHHHCVSRWLKTRPACPLCNRDWEFQKIER